jgi:hypothetical protein
MRLIFAILITFAYSISNLNAAESPPFYVKVFSDQINPKTGKPFRKKVSGIRDSSDKCVNGWEEARANVNKPHATSYPDADICGRMSFRANKDTIVRVDLVNYKPGKKPTPTPSPTPTPKPSPTPTRTPAPTPTRTPPPSYYCVNKVPGWCWDGGPSCEFLGPCECVKCASLTPTPRPTATPKPSPTFVINRMWWPSSSQANLTEAYGHEFSSQRYAKREWFYGVPDRASDSSIKATIASAKARKEKPRFFVAEPGSHWWCRSVMQAGGFLNPDGTNKDPYLLPDTLGLLNLDVGGRIDNLIKWGVSPGKPILVSVYIFGCKNQMSKYDSDLMASQLGVAIPAGYKYKTIRNTSWCNPDYPDTISVSVDAACFDKFLAALKYQHPEIGYVIPQLSNGCNAYGFDGIGLEVADKIVGSLYKYGYDPAIQLEDRNCQDSSVDDFWSAPPSADCPALKAIVDSGAMISLFWGWSYDLIKDELARCPK